MISVFDNAFFTRTQLVPEISRKLVPINRGWVDSFGDASNRTVEHYSLAAGALPSQRRQHSRTKVQSRPHRAVSSAPALRLHPQSRRPSGGYTALKIVPGILTQINPCYHSPGLGQDLFAGCSEVIKQSYIGQQEIAFDFRLSHSEDEP